MISLRWAGRVTSNGTSFEIGGSGMLNPVEVPFVEYSDGASTGFRTFELVEVPFEIEGSGDFPHLTPSCL